MRLSRVVRACVIWGRDQEKNKMWISEELIRRLAGLNEMGFAHSYEAWQEGKLVGGGFGF